MFPINLNTTLAIDLLIDKQAPELADLIEKNRLHLRQWLAWLDHSRSVDDSLKFINESNEKWKNRSALTLGILLNKTLVGVINYHQFNWQQGTASIGYWLDADRQGRGIISKACYALINLGFSELDLRTITISCAEKNFKSQTVPRRLGFLEQETIKDKEWLYDHHVNHIVFRMTRELWYKSGGTKE